MSKKKLLQDELDQVEYKLNCEMNWFRQEIAPLKTRKRELLEELKNLTLFLIQVTSHTSLRGPFSVSIKVN